MEKIQIEFKVKIIDNIFTMKKELSKKDTNCKPHEHKLYNSQLFDIALNRAYYEKFNYKSYSNRIINLLQLPEYIIVTKGNFLSTVKFELEF